VPAHLLSVVMPTHNRPEWLERAALSVLAQQGAELELLIVDDASSDHTPEVAERLADDPRVRLLRNPESLGPGGSRNRGIAEARGDLLGFCDDDDTWLPGAASSVLERFHADSEVGVVTSWHEVVHDRTGRTALFRGPLTYGAAQLLWFDLVAIPFGVIRRPMFADDLAVDANLRSCEDWDLWLRCAQTRPIATVPRALYSYHQHGGDRVTRQDSGPVLGRQGFLDRHAASMSPSCRIYHELVVAELGQGRQAVAGHLVAEGRRPVAAAAATAVLTAGALASAVGTRRRDPGLPARMMRRLVGPTTAADRRGTRHR
jgi:Glycosyl transferase family 2